MKSIDFINKVPKQVAESTAVEQPIVEQQELTFPEFNVDAANYAIVESLKENATGGATGAGSVAVVSGVLGEKGGFSKKDVDTKLAGYGNMLSRGGKVKVGK